MHCGARLLPAVVTAFYLCHSQLRAERDCILLAVVVRLNFTGQGYSGDRGRKGGRGQSSCCCLFMQLSNIRVVGSLLGGVWRGLRLSRLDLWRLALFEQFLPILPVLLVSCAPPSVSPGMWAESAHTPAFVKARQGKGVLCFFFFPHQKCLFFILFTI